MRYDTPVAAVHRFAALAGAMLLTACGSSDERTVNTALIASVEAQQRADAEDDGMVLCAQGTGTLTRSCTIEQAASEQGLVLTIRHPDGSFHRLLATRDGRGVIAADGAEAARVTVIGPDLIEVALGGDRYRLPATVRS